jgi:hypothetical protein
VQLVCHDGKPHSQAEDGNQKVYTDDLSRDKQAIEITNWLNRKRKHHRNKV